WCREAVVEFVRGDAHDQKPSVTARRGEKIRRLRLEFGELDGVTDGVFLGEVTLRKSLIDNQESRAAMFLVRIPKPSLHQGNAQGGKIFLAHQVHSQALVLRSGLPEDFKLGIESVIRRRGIAGDGRDADAGYV